MQAQRAASPCQKRGALYVQVGPRLLPPYSRPSTNQRLFSCSILLQAQHRFPTKTLPLSISVPRPQNSVCSFHTNRLRLACSHIYIPPLPPQPSRHSFEEIARSRSSQRITT